MVLRDQAPDAGQGRLQVGERVTVRTSIQDHAELACRTHLQVIEVHDGDEWPGGVGYSVGYWVGTRARTFGPFGAERLIKGWGTP